MTVQHPFVAATMRHLHSSGFLVPLYRAIFLNNESICPRHEISFRFEIPDRIVHQYVSSSVVETFQIEGERCTGAVKRDRVNVAILACLHHRERGTPWPALGLLFPTTSQTGRSKLVQRVLRAGKPENC